MRANCVRVCVRASGRPCVRLSQTKTRSQREWRCSCWHFCASVSLTRVTRPLALQVKNSLGPDFVKTHKPHGSVDASADGSKSGDSGESGRDGGAANSAAPATATATPGPEPDAVFGSVQFMCWESFLWAFFKLARIQARYAPWRVAVATQPCLALALALTLAPCAASRCKIQCCKTQEACRVRVFFQSHCSTGSLVRVGVVWRGSVWFGVVRFNSVRLVLILVPMPCVRVFFFSFSFLRRACRSTR